MNSESSNGDSTTVLLQSDQFIINPISVTRAVSGDSKEYQVDLARQSCQCGDFLEHRQRLPIGDPRRFCRHMVQVQSEFSDDLHPFVQSLFEVREIADGGMPNGASFAFFEIDGRLAFVGENRDRTTYFFIKGHGNTFHEFLYNRTDKTWISGKPDEPAPLLKFAFQARSQYGKQLKPTDDKKNTRSKQRARQNKAANDSPSNIGKYLFLALVTAVLAGGGYYYFNNKESVNAFVKQTTAKFDSSQSTNEEPDDPADRGTQPKTDSGKTAKESDAKQKSENAGTSTKTNSSESQTTRQPSENGPTIEPKQPSVDSQRDELTEFREWTYSDGRSFVVAKYKSFQNGKITLVRQTDLSEIEVQNSELSEQDQAYIAAIRRERRLQRARQNKNR